MSEGFAGNKLSQLPSSTTLSNGFLDYLADLLSYVLHPAILMVWTVALASFWTRGSLTWVVLDILILLIGLLPGLLYIYVKTRRGQFSHYHLLLKEERRITLPLLLIGVLVSFGLYIVTRAPVIMIRGIGIGLFAGLGAVIISRFWKISLHAAVAMGCAALFIPLSWVAMGVFAIAGLIVGLARVRVRHHTLGQVLVGWIYGFSMGSLSVLWLK